MTRVLKGSHSFTCTPRVHPLTEWTILAFSFPAEAGTHCIYNVFVLFRPRTSWLRPCAAWGQQYNRRRMKFIRWRWTACRLTPWRESYPRCCQLSPHGGAAHRHRLETIDLLFVAGDRFPTSCSVIRGPSRPQPPFSRRPLLLGPLWPSVERMMPTASCMISNSSSSNSSACRRCRD